MLKTYKSAEIKKYDKRPGLTGTFVHGESLTFAHWHFEKDAQLTPHSHIHSQITYVVSGKIRFEGQDGNSAILGPGDFIVFAPNEPHGGTALEESAVLDAFAPAREDFKTEMGWSS